MNSFSLFFLCCFFCLFGSAGSECPHDAPQSTDMCVCLAVGALHCLPFVVAVVLVTFSASVLCAQSSSVTRAARARIRDAETLCCCTAPPHLCHIFFLYIYVYTHTHRFVSPFFFLSVYSNRPVLPLLPAPFLLAVTALVFNFLQIVRVCVFSGR